MHILINTNKTVDQNASHYFQQAKKLRNKIKGAEEAIERTKQKIKKLEKDKDKFKEEVKIKKIKKLHWYEKFRWFRTSDNRLVVGGRDATTNEIIIKKYTEQHDLVFHTDMAGSPFFILKTEDKPTPNKILKEVADATCSFSRAFKLGLKTQSVFYVKPEQVTKEAQSGEYLVKGAFMIKGKTNYIENKINVAIGITKDNELMSGPVESIKTHCKTYLILDQGTEKVSDIAKKIRKKLNADLDDIIRVLPTGSMKVQAA